MAKVTKSGPGLAPLVATLKGLDGVKAEVGFFETASYTSGVSVAYVATIHEFGAPKAGIPPRPFMRPAVATYGPQWMELMKQAAAAMVAGSTTGLAAMELIASRAAADVSKSIKAVTSPPLAPETVRRKGHAKPLVKTGQLIQSPTHRVTKA